MYDNQNNKWVKSRLLKKKGFDHALTPLLDKTPTTITALCKRPTHSKLSLIFIYKNLLHRYNYILLHQKKKSPIL